MVKLAEKIFVRALQIVYFEFFIAHKFFQGPYILRPKDRIFYALKTVYIQFFRWLMQFPRDRIFYALETVYFQSIFFQKNRTVYFQLWTVYFPLMTVYFQPMTVYFPPGPYIFGLRPYIFSQDRIFYQDRIFSRTVYFTFQDRIFYYLIGTGISVFISI